LLDFVEYPSDIFADHADSDQLDTSQEKDGHHQGCEARWAETKKNPFYKIGNRSGMGNFGRNAPNGSLTTIRLSVRMSV
jgi:hypothetical protein